MAFNTYTYNPHCTCQWCTNNGRQPTEDGSTGHSWCYDNPHQPPNMKRYPPPKTGIHTGWSPDRDRTAQQRFRNALIRRSGGHCEYPGCHSTDRLQAHHDQAGYTPDSGRLLCWKHHKAEDPYAR